MGLSKALWAKPAHYLRIHKPDTPVLFFAPSVLQATARRFLQGFPGIVTFAVKSNPDEVVLNNLIAAGITGFDVASPFEMDLIARLAPTAVMHYNNPVRSVAEIAHALSRGVCSYSVDSVSELEKLAGNVPAEGVEVSVRFKLPVNGAAYNFGAKFGAEADVAVALLQRVVALGFTPSMTFHPGTQCNDPDAWDTYIRRAGDISRAAGVKLARLNVGGGFPAHRLVKMAPALDAIFARIDAVAAEVFGDQRPILVCEPGRAMVAESFSLATRVKAIRDDAHVFLNDGIYGGLAELSLIGIIDRLCIRSADGKLRTGAARPRIVFGPTCDSVDRLPGEIALPADMAEGDFVIFSGMGAYCTATLTRFNGYGELQVQTVDSLAC